MPNGMLVADGAQQLLADDHRHFSLAGDVHRSVLENPRRSEGRVLTAACAAADSVCMHELVAAGSKLGPRRVICRWPVRRNLQILGKQRARPRWATQPLSDLLVEKPIGGSAQIFHGLRARVEDPSLLR